MEQIHHVSAIKTEAARRARTAPDREDKSEQLDIAGAAQSAGHPPPIFCFRSDN